MLQYLLKFSISLAVLYVFYRAVLRPLTFYQWNRFYLLCYSLLSFVIPFIDISSYVSRSSSQQLINIIPAVTSYNFATTVQPAVEVSWIQRLSTTDWLLIAFGTGALVMLVKIFVQYISLRNIRRGAVLLNENSDVRLYETTAAVSPFSFGNAIYFNRSLHTEEELQRIIQHEFVHVKQKHTIDLLLGELLCVVNWYNPFAWLIRYSMRQNLEFIADNNVVANGLDKKEYQYLLLKVVGIPQYSIANNFNFSNLKKRIAMMNKMKSAKLHLTKFLFVLPLLVLLLLAFRNKIHEQGEFVFTGIIYNNEEPLLVMPGITVHEKYSGLSATTDANGYFKMKIPLSNDSVLKIKYDFALNNTEKTGERSKDINLAGAQNFSNLLFVGINKSVKDAQKNILINAQHEMWSVSSCYRFQRDPDFTFVQDKFNEYRQQLQTASSIASKNSESKKPFWFENGIPYLLFADGIEGNSVFFDKYETKASAEYAVLLDGKLTSIEEANAKVNRFELTGIGTCRAEYAQKEYGVNKNVFILYWKTKFNPLKTITDTIPPPPPPALLAPVAMELPAIPAVPSVNHQGYIISIADNHGECIVLVKDKSQKIIKAQSLEEWNKNKKANESKYGMLPPPPPPQFSPDAAISKSWFSNSDTSKKPLFVIDGIVQPENFAPNSIDANTIKSINVLKGQEAVAAYGERAAVGAILVTLGKPSDYTVNTVQPSELNIRNTYSNRPVQVSEMMQELALKTYKYKPQPAGTFEIRQRTDTNYFPKDVLVVIDGKEIPNGSKIADYVQPGDIERMTVLTDKTATDRYGEKGKHNVIEILTKKYKFETKDNTSYKADSSVRMHFDQFIVNGSIASSGNESFIDGAFSFETKTERPLIVFDGREFPEMITCSPRPGKYKMVTLNANQAVAKYGDKAKNGAIEITTLKSSQVKDKKNETITLTADKITWDKTHLVISGGSMVQDGQTSVISGDISFDNDFSAMPMVVYNGKQVTDFNAFKLTKVKVRIQSLNVKDSVAKYGSVAKNGAVEINKL